MKVPILLLLMYVLVFGYGVEAKSIKNSRHNLSSGSGLGNIKASDTSMVCIFCHNSHIENAMAPLWNRGEGAPVYTLYTSSTMQSIPGQPDGASKLCLSCHDGTIALGKVRSRTGEFNMLNTSLGKIPHGKPANLGNDLSDDHPISFDSSAAVSSSTQLRHPAIGDPVKYDGSSKVQCTSCHDPHNDLYKDFLVKDNRGAGICKTCHEPTGFNSLSTHDTASNSWNGQQGNPWPHTSYTTVTDNSCMNCHYSHNAGHKERLLSDAEEEVCLNCHNGTVGKDIEPLLNRTSGHRVKFYQGSHDPAENILTRAKHVECVDCHAPHQVNNSSARAPNVNGRLVGSSGMSIDGSLKSSSQFEYEVCLKCHGQDKYRVTTTINRQVDTSNLRIAFNPTNASFHPIAERGTGTWVPSLKPRYTLSSRIYCVDCHNSDAGVNVGGTGPKGPHGSNYEYILERQYETGDYTSYSSAKYKLCFKCHNPNSIMNDEGFEQHDKHIRGEDSPCSACHDPHGVPGNIGLINFDTNIVFPNRNGELRFEVIGDRGYCYLSCHGEDHNPEDYRRR
jgi:predicted CXXCH cytochrome family protein